MRSVTRLVLVPVVLAAVIAALIAYPRYRDDLRSARERIAHGSRVAATPCGPIEYAIAGDGPPILVVHGAGGGFDQGLLMARSLVGAGYRSIAVSRFGYLGTPVPADASPAAQADAYVCLLDALKIERIAVFGASAGAPSSLQMAIRHPERVSALVLAVPATFLPDTGGAGASVPPGLALIFDTALRWDFPFWMASKVARKTMIRRMLGTPPELLPFASADEQRQVGDMLDFVLPVNERRAGLLNDARVTTTMPRFELERIRAPTLIISAQDDLYGTFERGRYTADHIPGARFVGYRTGGHLLVGHQAESTVEMLAHLKSSVAGSG